LKEACSHGISGSSQDLNQDLFRILNSLSLVLKQEKVQETGNPAKSV
jgi:hypothetical protein